MGIGLKRKTKQPCPSVSFTMGLGCVVARSMPVTKVLTGGTESLQGSEEDGAGEISRKEMGLAQSSISQLSPMTFWAREFFAGGDCPVHCRMFSSNHGVSQLPPTPIQDCLQTLPKVPGGRNRWIENSCTSLTGSSG